ncbi:MAG: ABC transporter permease [Pseudomonadota bacterium]
MTPAFRTVFNKEIVENFRDRRTLMSALFAPLFGPIMFVGIMTLTLSRALTGTEKPLELPVLNADAAPGLIAFLEQENVDVSTAGDDRTTVIEAVRTGELDLALVIPDDFGAQLRAGQPVRVEVVADQSSSQAGPRADRASGLVNAWGRQIGALRLLARGIEPTVVQPLLVDQIDTSTPSGRSALILGMLTYFILFAMLMGGMYLAIDSTAGERERGSLEPLLTLPVSRGELITGKIAASCLYMLLSLAGSLVAFMLAIGFLPLEKLGMTANFGPNVIVPAFFIFAPFALVGASLMTVVASFTKSYKEAQTYMTFVLLLPTIPIIIAAVLTLRPTQELMLVPSLSQHLLVTELIKNEPIEPLWVALSAGSTLAIGIALAFLAVRLYRREGLLI